MYGDFSGFDPKRRVEVMPEDLLELEPGSGLYDEVKELRRKRKEGMIKSLPSAKSLKGLTSLDRGDAKTFVEEGGTSEGASVSRTGTAKKLPETPPRLEFEHPSN